MQKRTSGTYGGKVIQDNVVFQVDGGNPKSSFQTDTRAANFVDLNNTYLSSTSTDFTRTSTAFSMGCWVKVDNTGFEGIMGKSGLQGGDVGYNLYHHSSEKFFFLASSDGTKRTKWNKV